MKSLKNKLAIGLTALGIGAGGLSLAGCIAPTPQGDAFINYMGHVAAQTFITEEIKKEMGHSDYQQQTRQQQQQTNVNVPQQRYQEQKENIESPQFFNAAKEIREGVYTDRRDIFYPGETIYVVGRFNGGKITNFCLALDKGEQIPDDLVNGAPGVEIVFKSNSEGRTIAWGKFNASSVLKKYGNHYKVYWLRNDEIVGSRDFVIRDKRPDVYSSK